MIIGSVDNLISTDFTHKFYTGDLHKCNQIL